MGWIIPCPPNRAAGVLHCWLPNSPYFLNQYFPVPPHCFSISRSFSYASIRPPYRCPPFFKRPLLRSALIFNPFNPSELRRLPEAGVVWKPVRPSRIWGGFRQDDLRGEFILFSSCHRFAFFDATKREKGWKKMAARSSVSSSRVRTLPRDLSAVVAVHVCSLACCCVCVHGISAVFLPFDLPMLQPERAHEDCFKFDVRKKNDPILVNGTVNALAVSCWHYCTYL